MNKYENTDEGKMFESVLLQKQVQMVDGISKKKRNE